MVRGPRDILNTRFIDSVRSEKHGFGGRRFRSVCNDNGVV